MVMEWGFNYLKCDFLHCAAMESPKRYDPTMPRAAALALLMSTLRQAAGPETFILACGAPLGPCIGHVDAMRVSADHATHWLPLGPNIFGTRWFFAKDRTNLPAARNMVRNVCARMAMGGTLWHNDPDCLILREKDAFTLEQAQALASIAALSAGSLIFSDDPSDLPPDRLSILRALVPPLPCPAQPLDLISREIPQEFITRLQPCCSAAEALGSWCLTAAFN
jgi:alpha-galactosidase